MDERFANDLAVAQIEAEHTEAMRRTRVDAILPYMMPGRLLGGAFAALAAGCLYQTVNNAVFDSLFQP